MRMIVLFAVVEDDRCRLFRDSSMLLESCAVTSHSQHRGCAHSGASRTGMSARVGWNSGGKERERRSSQIHEEKGC